MRKLDDTCNGEVFEGPNIVCADDNIDCEGLVKIAKKVENAEEIYIAPARCLVRTFSGDEMVEFRLIRERNLGMNRNKFYFEDDPSIPRQILAVSDHKKYRDIVDIEEQIRLTVFHEDAHLSGIEDEEKAEKAAQDKVYGRY